MDLEQFCPRCEQGWFGQLFPLCPSCSLQEIVDSIEVTHADEGQIWIQVGALTSTKQDAIEFFIEHWADEFGYKSSLIDSETIYGWDGPIWLKPGVEPFAEGSEEIVANPGDPTSKPYWSFYIEIECSLAL